MTTWDDWEDRVITEGELEGLEAIQEEMDSFDFEEIPPEDET